MDIKNLANILAEDPHAPLLFREDCMHRDSLEFEKVYSQLTPEQRTYFDSIVGIGPHAAPANSEGVWPDKTRIEKYLVDNWGKQSVPMRYYRLIVGGKSYYNL